MRNHSTTTLIRLGTTLAIGFSRLALGADTVYKCVNDGKVIYTANPSSKNGQCQQTVIRDNGPNPEELARLLEQKKQRQEEEKIANEAALKEREIRAKEIEAAAIARRAQAAEEELRLLKRTPAQPPAPVVGYPLYYPYWGIGPNPIQPYPPNGIQHHHPHHSRGYEVPGQPTHNPHTIPPSGGVTVRVR